MGAICSLPTPEECWSETTPNNTWYPMRRLSHWGRVTHICVGKLTIIGSHNGLPCERRRVNIWTNAEILFIEPLGTNFSEILIEIHTFSFKKMHLKMWFGKRRPFRLGLDVLYIIPKHDSSCTSLIWKWFIVVFGKSYSSFVLFLLEI